MGIVRFGAPTELILQLKQACGVGTFVETGTFQGGTARWAADHFARTITIEGSKEIYESNLVRHRDATNLEFLVGDSRRVLAQVVPRLERPAIFWLDSHWCGEGTYGKDAECPLLDEIAAINRSSQSHFILIDDARFFLAPPMEPHRFEDWPTIDAVIARLKGDTDRYYVVVIEDVIVAVPHEAKELVIAYCQVAQRTLLDEVLKSSSIEGGLEAMARGLTTVASEGINRLAARLSQWRRS
jgi:hypothetical protein